MHLTVFFRTGARPWTSREKRFVMATLNDKRAWPFTWTEYLYTRYPHASDAQGPFWTIELSHQKNIDSEFKSGRISETGLSVTFLATNLTMFSLENWTIVPPLAPKTYNLVQYRTYLIMHECGHALGLDHPSRSIARGHGLAPIMLQHTKGIGSLDENIWPTKNEIYSLTMR